MQKIRVVTLIPTFECNLKCSYCYISKGRDLSKIEDDLIKSFEDPSYYINLVRTVADPSELEEIEIWGGESLLHTQRIIPTIQKFLDVFQTVNEITTSSNFTVENTITDIQSILNLLAKFPKRRFRFRTQISLDGPSDINDINRGEGVTDRVIHNIENLTNLQIPDNVDIIMHFKSTIGADNFPKFSDMEYCKNYLKFFDELYSKFDSMHIPFYPTMPSVVIPYNYSQLDGIYFTSMVNNFITISRLKNEFKVPNYFKMYDRTYEKNNDYFMMPALCGLHIGMGLLPNNMTFACHRGLDAIVDYYNGKNDLKSNENLVFLEEDFKNKYDLIIKKNAMYTSKTSIVLSELSILIRTMASIGEIDSIYSEPDKALNAAKYLTENVPVCVYSSYQSTGTFNMQFIGIVRLFLNGAHEAIENYNGRFDNNDR